jgi:putative methionine-R-sulfoxide reductase with GAF domain
MASTENTKTQSAEIQAVYRKRAIILSLTLTVAATYVVLNSYFNLAPGETLSATINFMIGGIVITLISAYLAYRWQVTRAVTLLIIMLYATIGFSLTQSTGISIYLVIFCVTTSLGIVSQTLPVERFRGINLLIAFAAIALVLLDLFYPYPRTVAADILTTVMATGVVTAVVVVLVVRELPRYPLHIKMALTFLVVAAVPILVLAVYNNYTTRQYLTADANENLLSAALQTSNRLDAFIESGLASIRAEARLLSLGDLDISNDSTQLTYEDRSRISTFLRAYSSKDPFLIHSYAFLDLNGTVFADTILTNIGRNESEWDYFQEALATPQPYFSSVQFLRQDQGRLAGYVHFSHVVYNRHGQAVGVLRARYNATVLQQIIAESSDTVGGNIYLALYDSNGFTLAHSENVARQYKFLTWPNPNTYATMRDAGLIPAQFQLTRHTESNHDLAASLATLEGSAVFEAVDVAYSSEPNLVAVTTSSSQPMWHIAAFQSQTALLPPIIAQTRSTTILSLVLMIFAVVVALGISQELVRPLNNLRQTADQITEGDLSARASITSQDEFGTLSNTFNNMAEQLQQTLASLETRVLERTRALEVASQVSRSLSTILDPDQLVKTVVDQVQTSFDYYHAHIYLFDEKENSLRMVGGTGQAGQVMLQQGHQIPYGKGLVGRAAAANNVVLIPNVADDPNWLANPLLPDTRAEIAVPISLGDEVLGVLDVQHNLVDGLTEQDANLLQAVANQVAIALRNAREYQTAQARAERQQLLNQINQKIQTTQNMEDALQIAVRELGQAVGATKTRARLHTTHSTNGDANGTHEG